MREANYEVLREAVQNYQSTLAWYQATLGSPNVEWDCGATLATFKRHIRHRGTNIIADLLNGLGEARSQPNEQCGYYEGVISDGDKRTAGLEAWEVRLPTHYDFRYGHPINADE